MSLAQDRTGARAPCWAGSSMPHEVVGATAAVSAIAGQGGAQWGGLRNGEGPLLTLQNICKRFPGVQANDAVSFSVAGREIHALLGENRAGKSTLVKLIYGLLRA